MPWNAFCEYADTKPKKTPTWFAFGEDRAEVSPIHPKAMPVILRTPDEIETWMTASPEEALRLQRSLPNGLPTIVAREKEDPPPIPAPLLI